MRDINLWEDILADAVDAPLEEVSQEIEVVGVDFALSEELKVRVLTPAL